MDSGVEEGSFIGLDYDPLRAKLIVLAPDRQAAIERAHRALSEWVVMGVDTNLPLLQSVLASRDFLSGRYATDLIARLPAGETKAVPDAAWIAGALALAAPRVSSDDGHSGEPWDDPSAWRPGA
jgi:acetyl/propionyl-CoA carboxylase alpha subunit